MTDVVWTDDFTVDHFGDRYQVYAQTVGSWSVDGTDLDIGRVGWVDPTHTIGGAAFAFVEIHIASWATLPDGQIGWTRWPHLPLGEGGTGIYLEFDPGAFAAAVGWIGEPLGDRPGYSGFHDGSLAESPADAPVVARFMIDRCGFVWWGLEVVGGTFSVGDSAQVIGGYARLPESAIPREGGFIAPGALSDMAPFAYVSGSCVVTEWSYGMIDGVGATPSEIQAQWHRGGVVKDQLVAMGGNPPGHGSIP